MTDTAARRNLADKIQVVLAKGGDHYDVADAILGAPTDTAAREKLAQIICDADLHSPLEKAGTNHRRIADAILSAFPHLGAPTEDVVEAAREIAHELVDYCLGDLEDENCLGDLDGERGKAPHKEQCDAATETIAAAITAHGARERADEREAWRKATCSLCRAGHPLSATRPEVHQYHGTFVMCKAAAIRARP